MVQTHQQHAELFSEITINPEEMARELERINTNLNPIEESRLEDIGVGDDITVQIVRKD